ncbi:MAG: hypothetical protein A4E58_00275 [Syntrophorhabdus sp. PtaB.Bin006]|nr:MAG: hypothetical protein A4E58_00275 [Syntrophorhabdus sp. PtaB.Bin006]
MKTKKRVVILYLILLNLGFFCPLILLFITHEYDKLLSVLWGIAPIYLTFLFFMLMALSMCRKGMEVGYLFHKFDGPIQFLRIYYDNFVKGQSVSFLWWLFWLSFVSLVAKAVYELSK